MKAMFTPLEAINRLCDKREIFYDENGRPHAPG